MALQEKDQRVWNPQQDAPLWGNKREQDTEPGGRWDHVVAVEVGGAISG